MNPIEKPIFYNCELDEEKTLIEIGYLRNRLTFGHTMDTRTEGKLNNFWEFFNGTKKRREVHTEINKFAFADFDKQKHTLCFVIPFYGTPNLTDYAKNALKKHEQLLQYYLHRAGWINITEQKSQNTNKGEFRLSPNCFVIPFDNEQNIEMFCKLSPSIGFYTRKQDNRPSFFDMETYRRLVYANSLPHGHDPL